MTALHVAAFAGQSTITEVLLQFGADVNAQDQARASSLQLNGLRMFFTRRAAHLSFCGRTQDGDTPLLCAACTKPQPEVLTIQHLIEYGANVNAARKVNGFTALHFFTSSGNVALMRLLLQNGASYTVLNKVRTEICQFATWLY